MTAGLPSVWGCLPSLGSVLQKPPGLAGMLYGLWLRAANGI
jgi:hypothetical protein